MESAPRASLALGDDHRLYGTTELSGPQTNSGAIFRVDTSGSNYIILHDFWADATDGKLPNTLAIGSDGMLYGSTQSGGTSNWGTIFRIGRDATDYRILHRFRMTPDGRTPRRLIEASDGKLYGVTASGGVTGSGTVFAIEKSGSNFSVITPLVIDRGIQPRAGLLETSNGMLYGTAALGGTNLNRGTIFRLNKDGSAYEAIHHFGGGTSDGQTPLEGVILGSDRKLYGTTVGGGAHGAGTVYSVSLDGSDFRLLHSFEATGNTGRRPACTLIEARDGSLVGTTPDGGNHGRGTVFKVNKDGSGFVTLWHFAGAPDGARPSAGLTISPDGSAFGTTEAGGAMYVGSVFRLDPVLPTLRIEHGSNGLVVHWPRTSTIDQLEQSTTLDPSSWMSASGTLLSDDREHHLALAASPPTLFLRVRRSW